MAVDPTLRLLAEVANQRVNLTLTSVPAPGAPTSIPAAVLGACADDLGAAIFSLRLLIPLSMRFKLIERLFGLKINANKCALTPVARPLTPKLAASISAWLAEHIPQWASTTISSSLKYLGFHLGSAAAFQLWLAPVRKWRHRTLAIARSRASPLIAALTYNQRSITTLGYVAQLSPPP